MRDDIGDEPGVAGLILACQHHCLAYRGMTRQLHLDLARLNSVAPNLDLVIETTEKLDVPVGEHSRTVARPVEPPSAVGREGIGREPLLGQVRATEVTARQDAPADVQLARDTNRREVPALVEDIDPSVRDRSTDRRPVRPAFGSTVEREGRDYMTFSRTVLVVEVHPGRRAKNSRTAPVA